MAALASPVEPPMKIVMHPDATPDEIAAVSARLAELGADVTVSEEAGVAVVTASLASLALDLAPWDELAGVARVDPGVAGGRRVGRTHRSEDTVVRVGDVTIGDGTLVVVAGPCAVESREQMLDVATDVKRSGAKVLRGDAFKPRTSPYSFQGLGKAALEILAEARAQTGLPVVAEVLDPRDVDLVASYADMLRIGTRNMSNQALLAEVGRQPKPVQLKRGRAATIGEWLDAAEHVVAAGNTQIVLVERGIRRYDTTARNTLDITALPVVKTMSHLPVMVDPSHAGGRRDLVAPLSRAAVAAGADGLLLDVHPRPDEALVDGGQALTPAEFADLMEELQRLHAALAG